MAGILPGAVRRNNPKLLDQVPAVSRLKHYSIRTEQAYTDWIRRFIVFHTKRNNGVWRDPREDDRSGSLRISHILRGQRETVPHRRRMLARIERADTALTLPAGVWMDRQQALAGLEWRTLRCPAAPLLAPRRQ
jgi:hypothetical protein